MTQNFFYKQDTLPNLTEEKVQPTPTHIGPYKIEGLLNKGGMSFLYLGIHPDTKQPLAIKILSPDYLSDEKAIERFLKETHIISLSNHPNIVKLYGEGKWEQGLYIAMEWIRGISLRQFIMQQSLSLRRALEIILQVSYALHHLHSHGIIHRDLKPENILITEDGGIKVIDFGIAQVGQEKALLDPSKRLIMGTPNYMSPELKNNTSTASFASDIYSLGVISYELILGKLSYGVLQTELLPKGLRRIIEKALALSLEERYKIISEFINDVSRYLTSGDIEKERPGSDQIKEVVETFQKVSQNISVSILNEWEQIDVGMSKHSLATQFGLYIDALKLSNGAFLFILAESSCLGLESIAYVSNLRGYLRSLVLEKMKQGKTNWDLADVAQVLNEFVFQDPLKQTYAFSGLLLNPFTEQLSFINAGLNQLIHISAEGRSSILSSNNPLLGQERNPEFTQVVDNWNVAETLLFHCLAPSYKTEPYQQKQTEKILLESVEEDRFLSAQAQSDLLVKKAMLLSFHREQKQSKVLLSIQRIS
ncbi:MAG: serine/threonine protein kinase [Chlamydiae bacterium]|nr:serine/threonine protein kinase [Chlamydiota bacterium]